LTHSFRGFSLWSANFTAFRLVIRQKCHGRRNGEKKKSHFMESRKQRLEKGPETRHILQRHASQ
jgi:hypothetical protein